MGCWWSQVVVGVVLFVLLSPGLIFQLPAGNGNVFQFANMQTSLLSIILHAIIFFAIFSLYSFFSFYCFACPPRNVDQVRVV
ncbi:hypothetical protein AAHE18_04G015200 [Arachis hypogaea]|uniref:Transmembrane protein n=1 Tax=Arachis hypogaea TaxID=3818 RepID=A0A445DKQ3_ARAHY|nr:hypothetical protein Ahy_A04g021529 [Arachis hypogaea]